MPTAISCYMGATKGTGLLAAVGKQLKAKPEIGKGRQSVFPTAQQAPSQPEPTHTTEQVLAAAKSQQQMMAEVAKVEKQVCS